MVETPSPTAVANKGADYVLKYAPPLIGLAVGYIVGDFIDISSYLLSSMNKSGQARDVKSARKIVILITAGIYAVIGAMIWRSVDHFIGGLVGGFFMGIALRGLYKAVTL